MEKESRDRAVDRIGNKLGSFFGDNADKICKAATLTQGKERRTEVI